MIAGLTPLSLGHLNPNVSKRLIAGKLEREELFQTFVDRICLWTDGMPRDAGASARQTKPWEHMDVRPSETALPAPAPRD